MLLMFTINSAACLGQSYRQIHFEHFFYTFLDTLMVEGSIVFLTAFQAVATRVVCIQELSNYNLVNTCIMILKPHHPTDIESTKGACIRTVS